MTKMKFICKRSTDYPACRYLRKQENYRWCEEKYDPYEEEDACEFKYGYVVDEKESPKSRRSKNSPKARQNQKIINTILELELED